MYYTYVSILKLNDSQVKWQPQTAVNQLEQQLGQWVTPPPPPHTHTHHHYHPHLVHQNEINLFSLEELTSNHSFSHMQHHSFYVHSKYYTVLLYVQVA